MDKFSREQGGGQRRSCRTIWVRKGLKPYIETIWDNMDRIYFQKLTVSIFLSSWIVIGFLLVLRIAKLKEYEVCKNLRLFLYWRNSHFHGKFLSRKSYVDVKKLILTLNVANELAQKSGNSQNPSWILRISAFLPLVGHSGHELVKISFIYPSTIISGSKNFKRNTSKLIKRGLKGYATLKRNFH